MKNRPVHENLDTSFVNLSALIRYLRRRQFVGRVRVELSGYEADIVLTAENQLQVREYDHIAGRVAGGEQALQRLLIRAREPGGIINVYQTVEENEPVVEQQETAQVKTVVAEIKSSNGNGKHENPSLNGQKLPPVKIEAPEAENAEPPKSNPKLEKLPFELRNRFEEKARPKALSAQQWQTLLDLTNELLTAVDTSLAAAQLDFPAAFEKARAEISADYPFLTSFHYRKGKVTFSERPGAKLFVASLTEALRRILDKLAAHPKFAEVHRATTQKILAILHHRQTFYDKFALTEPLQKILGV